MTYLQDVVHAIFLSPIKKVVEHQLGFVHIELSRSQKPQKVVVVILRMISEIVIFDILPEFLQVFLLVLTHIIHESMQNQVSYSHLAYFKVLSKVSSTPLLTLKTRVLSPSFPTSYLMFLFI